MHMRRIRTCSTDEALIIVAVDATDFRGGQYIIRTSWVQLIVTLMAEQTNFRKLLYIRQNWIGNGVKVKTWLPLATKWFNIPDCCNQCHCSCSCRWSTMDHRDIGVRQCQPDIRERCNHLDISKHYKCYKRRTKILF